MYTIENTLTVSELRKSTSEVFERVDEMDEPLTIISNSKPVAVLMSIRLYRQTQERNLHIDHARYVKAMDFFVHPLKKLLIKKKGFDSVKAIRGLRD